MGCGELISGLAMQSGTVYTWGKGEHEKPKFNDYLEYSSPFVILEQKLITHLAFGRAHVMALDKLGKVYSWGDSAHGCLGFGDPKRRAVPSPIPYFENPNMNVVDIGCGDGFTVVIATLDEPILAKEVQVEVVDEQDEILSPTLRQRESVMSQTATTFQYLKEYKSNRNPLPAGGVEMTGYLRGKVRNVINKN